MSGAACKVVINSETASAMVGGTVCTETFHALVEMPGFAKLSKKKQSKYYEAQILHEVELTAALNKFCEAQNKMHLEMGVAIDAES